MNYCLNCPNVITSKDKRAKFCSQSCAASYNNKGRVRDDMKAKRPLCLHCKTEPVKFSTTKYCSHECSAQARKTNHLKNWVEGKEMLSNGDGTLSHSAKRYLFKEAKYRCTACGWCEINPTLGYPILTVDHIDGDWRNNHYDNLVVLCFNCHTLTPTFGALNMGTKSPRSNKTRKTHVS